MQYETNFSDLKIGEITVPEDVMTALKNLYADNWDLAKTPGNRRMKARKDAEAKIANNNNAMHRLVLDFISNILARMGYNVFSRGEMLQFKNDGCDFYVHAAVGFHAGTGNTTMPNAVKSIPDGPERLWFTAESAYVDAYITCGGYRPENLRQDPSIFKDVNYVRAWVTGVTKYHLEMTAMDDASFEKMNDLTHNIQPVMTPARISTGYVPEGEKPAINYIEFEWPDTVAVNGNVFSPKLKFERESLDVGDKRIRTEIQAYLYMDDVETAIEFAKDMDSLMVKFGRRKSLKVGN